MHGYLTFVLMKVHLTNDVNKKSMVHEVDSSFCFHQHNHDCMVDWLCSYNNWSLNFCSHAWIIDICSHDNSLDKWCEQELMVREVNISFCSHEHNLYCMVDWICSYKKWSSNFCSHAVIIDFCSHDFNDHYSYTTLSSWIINLRRETNLFHNDFQSLWRAVKVNMGDIYISEKCISYYKCLNSFGTFYFPSKPFIVSCENSCVMCEKCL